MKFKLKMWLTSRKSPLKTESSFSSPYPLPTAGIGWSTSIITGHKEGGCSLEGRIVSKREPGLLTGCGTAIQALDWGASSRLTLCEKKINFSEPPSFWMFLLYLAKLNPHRYSAARHTLTGSLDEWSFPKKCWAVTGHFTWVRPVFFLQHISSTFSMEAEVSAAEPFATDPGQDESCLKKCLG